jgi:predicted HTH domain antitoxin
MYMSILITDEMLNGLHFSESEFKLEISIFLFQQRKISLGKASQFAELTRLQFQKILSSREIPIHYDVKDFIEDMNFVFSK